MYFNANNNGDTKNSDKHLRTSGKKITMHGIDKFRKQCIRVLKYFIYEIIVFR